MNRNACVVHVHLNLCVMYCVIQLQVPLEQANVTDDQVEDSYELSHRLIIPQENVSEANVSSLHVGIERAGISNERINTYI